MLKQLQLSMNKYGIIVALLISIVFNSCSNNRDKRTENEISQQRQKISEMLFRGRTSEPVTVKVIEVGKSDMVSSDCFVGSVKTSHSSLVISPASGTLTDIYVREGQRIRKGQVVAKIESQQIQSAYDAAAATLRQAEDGMARLKMVYETGSVSEVQMVEMETKLSQAKSMEMSAKNALDNCTIKSPMDGIVQDVYPVGIGIEVTIAERIASIIDIDNPEIHFPLPENEYHTIKIGDSVRVEIPALNITAKGYISVKGLVASSVSHSYDCQVRTQRPIPGLMPGMVSKIYISKSSGGGIVIPSSAVSTDMEGRCVWTVTNDIVGKKHVTVEGYSGKGILIGEGLEDGDLVIVEGASKVSTGMKVKTIE